MGTGGLISYPEVRIRGDVFEDVFRLPRVEAALMELDKLALESKARLVLEGVNAPEGGGEGEEQAPAKKPTSRKAASAPARPEPKKSEGDKDEDWTRLIAHYETRFAKTGYKRVYVKGDDGDLYVAVTRNPIHVQRYDQVATSDGERQGPSGTVLHVVDVDTTIRDVTLGFWGDVIRKSKATILSLLGKRLNTEIQGALEDAIVGDKKPDKEEDGSLRRMLSAGGTVVGAGSLLTPILTAAAHVPPVAAVVISVGVVITGMNVADLLIAGHDKQPFYQAVGVTVNTNRPIHF
jgi:hypothetical protein